MDILVHPTLPYAFKARIGPIAPLKKNCPRTTAIGQDCVYFVLGTVGQRSNTNITKSYVKEKWKGCEMKFSGQ